MSTIKYQGSGYSGCLLRDEHLLVRKPTANEASHVTMFLHNRPHRALTPREILLALHKMQTSMEERKIDEDWIVSHVIDEAENERNRGVERLEAIKILARIGGQEIEKPNGLPLNRPQIPLFMQFNNFEAGQPATIQDKRRQQAIIDAQSEVKIENPLPDSKTLEKMRDQLEIPEVNPLVTELQKNEIK